MNRVLQHLVISTGRNVRDDATDGLLRNRATRDRFHPSIVRFVTGDIFLVSSIMQDVQAKQRITLSGEICLR
jgi:hypothetical protein